MSSATDYNARSSRDMGWRVRAGGPFQSAADPAFAASVREFQAAQGGALTVDGKHGPMTGRAIVAQINDGTPLGLSWNQAVDYSNYNQGAPVRPPAGGGGATPPPPPAPPLPPVAPVTPPAAKSPWPGRIVKGLGVAALLGGAYWYLRGDAT